MNRRTCLQTIKILLLGLFLICCTANTGLAATDTEVKAAFLCQFPKFVDWPDSAFSSDDSFYIGILGDDPFGSTLDSMVSGKTIGSRRIIIKRSNNPDSLLNCQIVYICSSEKSHLSRILDHYKGASILTVSDIDGFARKGGVVNFIYKDNKIALEINPDAAKRSKLKVSSKLLRLADLV